ncbi:MAG: glucose 1-dehydrogenase [Novosphingobium sp.]|nr:glucose 1-dehydrogenase [Novosphingobium sp.]
MSGRVAGKTALITGAARGLGAATARKLAEEGAKVLLTDIDEQGAMAQAEAIDTAFGSGTAFAAKHDVTSEEDWEAALALARDRLGGLSVLVNNAGIAPGGSIESVSYETWKKAFAINVDGVFLGCKAALPLLRENQPASIVNMSSISALIAGPALIAYNASKAAVWMMTKSIALQCAKKGWDIRCNSVHPTFVDTDILENFRLDKSVPREDTLDKLSAQVPIGRIGTPEEIALGVLYLASDESRYMTGAELKLDGGISAM